MARYMLVARDTGDWADFAGDISPEEIEAVIGRYAAWAEKVAQQGKLLSGEKLKDGEGRVVRAERGNVRVTDGPHAASKEVVGGYWLLELDSYEEGVALLQDHPHLEFGSLELREIEAV